MSQINSNTKDDFQVALLLSCFVGHPVQITLVLLEGNDSFGVLSRFVLYSINVYCTACFNCTKIGPVHQT